jgi:hypothetical protein
MSDIDVIQTPVSTIVSIVASVGAVCGPIVMAWLVNRNARLMKAADYERQDEVAARLNARQDEIAALAAMATRAQEQAAKMQSAKLEQIHSLVNSNLTAAMQDQLDTRQANLVLLTQALETRTRDGLPIDPQAAETLAATKVKIAELSAQLADRKRQTVEAEKQLAVDIARKVE